jgi:hypothetical protein
MSTLFEKFPGVPDVWKKVLIYPVAVRFTALLAAGKFTFPKVTLDAFTGNAGEIFVLDGVTLAGDLDALTFSNAINPAFNAGFFSLQIIRAGNGHPVTLAPFRFSAYNQGETFAANFAPTATQDNKETFQFQLDGELLQTPEIVALGKTEISLTLVANIFRAKEGMLSTIGAKP